MEKKENERDISNLLSLLRESMEQSEKIESPTEDRSEQRKQDSEFDRELADRLEEHLRAENEKHVEQADKDELSFDVAELEIVADGTLDPHLTETSAVEDEEELPDWEALMARMTPEQRARFEQEMNISEEAFSEEISKASDVTDVDSPREIEADDAEKDEYELPDVEAFRVLETRMTPEQRIQFEEALREVQEGDAEETTNQVESLPEDHSSQEDDILIFGEISTKDETNSDVSELDSVGEIIEQPIVVTMPEDEQEQYLKENSAIESCEGQGGKVSMENPDPVADVEIGKLEEEKTRVITVKPSREENSDPEDTPTFFTPAEEEETPVIGTEPSGEKTDDSEEAPSFFVPEMAEISQELIPEPSDKETRDSEEIPTFFSAESDEGTEDMPIIKVGVEPSVFTLAEESGEEVAEDDAALAELLARMSPEQLARIREVMMQEEENKEMPADNGASSVEMTAVETSEEQRPPEIASDVSDVLPSQLSLQNTAPQEIEEEPETVQIPVSDATEQENCTVAIDGIENIDGDEEAIEEETAHNPLEAYLTDPEKLEELMSRLTPEQAAELERALRGEDEEPSEDETASMFEESTFADDVNPSEEAEHSAVVEDKISFNDILDEQNAKIYDDESTEDLATFERRVDVDADESDENEDEEAPLMEISEDMTNEEISLMLALGCEKELVHTLGKERVEQVKQQIAREEAHDPEFSDAYAYMGQEYRLREQTNPIRDRYKKEKHAIWARLGGTAIFALLLFLYECCGVFRGAFGGILDPAHYPVIAIMAGWQLLVFASAFSWRQLLRGIRSAFVLEPNHHAMTAIVVAVVMFNNILMAIVFKGSSLYLYNFPAVLCLLCSVLCDLADVRREELTFEVVSSPGPQYAAEAVSLPEEQMGESFSEEEASENHLQTPKNAVYVRRMGLMKNYFRRTNRKTTYRQILNFVFLPLLAFAIVMGITTALIGNGTVPALSTFVVSILLCMPMAYNVLHSFPQYCEARRLHKKGCAIVGESAVEEYNGYSTVIFEDKELFPPLLIKTKGLKLYENNMIYGVILKISLLFREIGGPVNEVLDLDKEEMKRFLASGQAGALAEGRVILERVTEEGMIARMGDGSQVVAGSVAFLQANGIHVRPNAKDQQLLQSGDMSILYLAFDGKLSARFYVDYQPDPDFETLAGMLHEDAFRVAVRTMDPGIYDDMIAHKCLKETPAIHTVRVAVEELTEYPSSGAKVDSGLICHDDPRKMLLPLRAIRNLKRLHRFGLKLYTISLFVNVVVTILLTAFSVSGYMSSLFVSLYMLVWLATSLILTRLFLNK